MDDNVLGIGWMRLHKWDNRWMQMISTNGFPLMKTSGNYHLAYQYWIHVPLVTTML
jgi:hypothetical protein